MGKVVLSIGLTLVIIYVVPFLIYGGLAASGWIKPPEHATPQRFLLGTLATKIGTAVAFVLIFYLARDTFSGRLLVYAALWWLMFVLSEFGMMIERDDYSWKYVVGGIISETIYCPLAAYVTNWLIGGRP